jgi:hypothetical protein
MSNAHPTVNVAAQNGNGIEIAAACSECWDRLDQAKWDRIESIFHGNNRKCDFCEMRQGQLPARRIDLARKALFYVR